MSTTFNKSTGLDESFRAAVSAIDAGDVARLQRLIATNPALVRERLKSPGSWLRDAVGRAVDGFFRRPYLLWFVAEDPVRNGKLPENIAAVARAIIEAARRYGAANLQEQLDYALTLVSWSWIARQCGVQIALIDVLVDAGADLDENPNNALVNGNFAAAEHLVERGANLTLATALCLGRWDDVDRLVATVSEDVKQFSFVLSALNGKADALRRMIRAGIDVNRPSRALYPHGTPLHHAVCSGSLEAVQVLVEAGAKLNTKDKAWGGTPLGWAEHYIGEAKPDDTGKQYQEIAGYLQHAETSRATNPRRST
jgi:peptide-methionine (S)-S-oxide reductase